MMTNKQSEKSKVLKGFFWKFAERISSQGVSFILSVILARLLLPEEYGIIAMLQIFIVIANVFITSGFASSLIQKKDADNIDFSTMLWCSMSMSIFLYLVIFILAPYIASFYKLPQLTSVLRVYAISLILSGYNSIQNAWISRNMIFKKNFFSSLSGTIGAGILGIIMAYNGFGVWSLVTQSLSNIFINMIVLKSIIPWRPSFVFSKDSAKRLSNYGFRILLTNLLSTICNEIRQLLIGKFYSPADLAFYNRGKQIPHLFNTNIDNTINSVLFPALSNHSDNPEEVKKLTRKTIKTSSYILFFFMGLIFVIAEPLTELLLTEKWLPSVPYMKLMCISGMISSVSTANLQAIKAIGRSDVTLKLEFYKKPVFILMLIISVNISVYAVACTMPLYSLYAAYVNMNPNKKLLNYNILEQLNDYKPAFLLLIAMLLITYPVSFLQINKYILCLLQILTCVSSYLVLSLIFKVSSLNYIYTTIKDSVKK